MKRILLSLVAIATISLSSFGQDPTFEWVNKLDGNNSNSAVAVSNDAVQIFGGYGYTKDFPVEKFYRDSKLCTIGEGTSEIQKLVISREILK